MNVRVSPLLFAVVVSGSLPACMPQFRAERPVSLTGELAAGTPLEVYTQNGHVSVSVDPGVMGMVVDGIIVGAGKSESEARMRAESIRVDVVVRDGKTVVQPVYPNGDRRSSEGCSFVIRVQSLADVLIDSSNGAIDLNGGMGAARLDTSNGAVRVHGYSGSLEVDSSNGALVIEDVDGDVDADTSNGSIVVRNGGDLTHALALSSSNGDVTIELAGGATGTLHAETSNGLVSLEGINMVGSSGSASGNVCDVDFGQPGPRHHVSTSNGSVSVRVRVIATKR
jgi:DUF4097 and DUF4098 domain-containing protein YvlB